ncbi:MAG TPA: ATP-dependent DNA ligase [Acidimicrobiales bacterium]|nr:ATP-dependent DNA ligase [Acidimicrobiales bacterium]
MRLPVLPPVAPMLAKLARELPVADGLLYEPKWDGFRCIVFRDGDEVELGSRNERPLTRYFPELVAALQEQLPDRCVMDGEIVIVGSRGLDFDALLQRIHPADSRVRMLAASTPASFVAFDLLALDDEDMRSRPFSERRELLVGALGPAAPPVHVTPATTDPAVAGDWFRRFEGAGLDGVVVKRGDLPYREDERVMVKVKHERTADCVVAGFRWHKHGGMVGSLLLGLFDDQGTLHHVGVTASFTTARRKELVDELAPYRAESLDGHPWAAWAGAEVSGRMPGGHSRWNAKRDLSWEALRPDLVCEVAYDHMQGDRFRHAATFKRWRPDREPPSCTYAQLDTAVPAELSAVFGAL